MEIVCVSHNAPPLNDAEALCTARLLSALVKYGLKVKLVTADSAASLDPTVAAELLDPRIEVTRVPASSKYAGRMWGMARSQFHGPHVEWLAPAIKAARSVLRATKQAVLLTRAFPMVSNLVGHYCRNYASAWVAHFSDPFPLPDWRNHVFSPLAQPINRRWAKRILRHADLITVTCHNVIRYMEDKAGCTFADKAMVLHHLGLPKLRRGTFALARTASEFVVAYIGNLMTRRRPDLLLKGALIAMERHPEIRFLQYGNVDREILELCETNPAFRRLDIRPIGNLNPRDAADLQEQVDVNCVVDTDLGIPFSPLCLSKYVHSVCARRPLLLLSREDSEMARFTKIHGGGMMVPFSDESAVAEAIEELFVNRGCTSPKWVPSGEYTREFSPEKVIPPFVERLERLLAVRRNR